MLIWRRGARQGPKKRKLSDTLARSGEALPCQASVREQQQERRGCGRLSSGPEGILLLLVLLSISIQLLLEKPGFLREERLQPRAWGQSPVCCPFVSAVSPPSSISSMDRQRRHLECLETLASFRSAEIDMLVISGKDFLQAGPKRGAKVSMRVCRRGVGDSGFKVLCGWISHFWRRLQHFGLRLWGYSGGSGSWNPTP